MKSSSNPVGRPPAFAYQASGVLSCARSLHCDAVSLTKLAEKHGTPLYVYSGTSIARRFTTFDKAFSRQAHTVCYSVKANSNISILRMLAKLGSGFDVVSGGELERVLRADRKAARHVVFSGVGKTAEEMDAALRAGILMFNLESEAELELLASCASRLRKNARVAFRVNPNVDAETHPYISTGLHQHKFGVPIERARELYARAAQQEFLKPVGVSVHIGSQITNVSPFADTMQRVIALVRELLSDGLNIGYIDAGGGLGIPYHDPHSETSFAKTVQSYARAITAPLAGLGLHLLLEPGRAVIGPAGVLVTRALYTKENGGKRFLVVDAAMNDLIRPSLYGAYHEIVPVAQPLTPRAKKSAVAELPSVYDVVGPICESGDFFARDRELPPIAPRELVAILDTGAYGMSLASNYNTRPRASEILVTEKSAKIIRRRETIDDLLRNEL